MPMEYEDLSGPISTVTVQQRRGLRSALPRVIGVLAVGAMFVFLYSPLMVIAVFSFNSSQVQTVPLADFTLTWYQQLAANAPLLGALANSLRVSVAAVAVSVVMGTLLALSLWGKFRGSSALRALIALPMLLPGMVLGLSLQLTFRMIGLEPSLVTLVAAHTVFITPVVLFLVGQRLSTLDPSLVQAASDLGATPVRGFFTVVFPQLRTPILAAALLGFTLSFDELAVSFFVSGFEQTLPVYVWSLMRLGFDPQVNAVFTLLAVLSVASVLVAFTLMKGRGKGRPGGTGG